MAVQSLVCEAKQHTKGLKVNKSRIFSCDEGKLSGDVIEMSGNVVERCTEGQRAYEMRREWLWVPGLYELKRTA